MFCEDHIDWCTDTPFHPPTDEYTIDDCVMTSDWVDYCGNTFSDPGNILPYNIMAQLQCANEFTNGQIDRMRTWIQMHPEILATGGYNDNGTYTIPYHNSSTLAQQRSWVGEDIYIDEPIVFTQKKSNGIGPDVYDQDNIEAYRQLKILQWALIEGPALINALFYFLFGYNLLHLLVAGILLVILWFSKPQEVKI